MVIDTETIKIHIMKRMKTLLVIVAFLGTVLATHAQRRTVVKVYPRHGTVVTTITSPKVIVHKNKNFYYADGVWYKARGRKYVVCAAPRGVVVNTLPRGSKVVYVKGRRLYKYRGVWYKRTGRQYVVVTV